MHWKLVNAASLTLLTVKTFSQTAAILSECQDGRKAKLWCILAVLAKRDRLGLSKNCKNTSYMHLQFTAQQTGFKSLLNKRIIK